MDEELISKRELLSRYSISYGALYRWKRKGLIPEEWFIKKATVTGQETFFPAKLICERVELIQSQKDDISLDDLSKLLNKEKEEKAILIVKTDVTEIKITLTDIRSVFIDRRKGDTEDITNIITKKENKGGNNT